MILNPTAAQSQARGQQEERTVRLSHAHHLPVAQPNANTVCKFRGSGQRPWRQFREAAGKDRKNERYGDEKRIEPLIMQRRKCPRNIRLPRNASYAQWYRDMQVMIGLNVY